MQTQLRWSNVTRIVLVMSLLLNTVACSGDPIPGDPGTAPTLTLPSMTMDGQYLLETQDANGTWVQQFPHTHTPSQMVNVPKKIRVDNTMPAPPAGTTLPMRMVFVPDMPYAGAPPADPVTGEIRVPIMTANLVATQIGDDVYVEMEDAEIEENPPGTVQ